MAKFRLFGKKSTQPQPPQEPLAAEPAPQEDLPPPAPEAIPEVTAEAEPIATADLPPSDTAAVNLPEAGSPSTTIAEPEADTAPATDADQEQPTEPSDAAPSATAPAFPPMSPRRQANRARATIMARPILRPIDNPVRLRRKLPHEVARLMRKTPYYGLVRADLTDHCGLDLMALNDDPVAASYFYYGADAHQGLTMFLWTSLLRDGGCRSLAIGPGAGIYALAAVTTDNTEDGLALLPENELPRLTENSELNACLDILEAHPMGDQEALASWVEGCDIPVAAVMVKSDPSRTELPLDPIIQDATLFVAHSAVEDITTFSTEMAAQGYLGWFVNDVSRRVLPTLTEDGILEENLRAGKVPGHYIFSRVEDTEIRLRRLARRAGELA